MYHGMTDGKCVHTTIPCCPRRRPKHLPHTKTTHRVLYLWLSLTDRGGRLKHGGGRGSHPVADDTRGRQCVQAVRTVGGDGAGTAGLGTSRSGNSTATHAATLPAVLGTAAKKSRYRGGGGYPLVLHA